MPAPPCADELKKLYDAYMALAAGEKEATVTFGDRSVSYTQANMVALQRLYSQFWNQCGAAEGYPHLGPQRGPPLRARFV